MLILLYIAPILCLLICLIVLKLSAVKTSIISFFITLIIFSIYFKPSIFGALISIAKGWSLALFVILIVCGAMFLYNLVNEAKALDVINKNIEIIINNKFHQFILLSWAFAPFLQGIAGFGVPIIVVTSILIALGFEPIKSACAVLVGHSWAIAFGSMGSSIYAINMVTQTPISEIIVDMAMFGPIAMFCMGMTVCFIYGGAKHMLKGLPFILVISIIMSISLNILARLGMLSVIGLLTAFSGVIAGFIISRIRNNQRGKIDFYSAELNLFQAVLPYILTIILSVTFFILNPTFTIDFSFQGYETLHGQFVPPEEAYVSFNVLKFPFTIILIASFISMFVFYKKKTFNVPVAKAVVTKTLKKCIPTSVALLFLVSIAVMMIDSGMIEQIAVSLASATGDVYPLFAPFIGILGAFITGSSTNSNIIFGSLQEVAANTLGMSTARMCAAQAIGASVGASISPTMIALTIVAANVQGQESHVYKKIIIPVLITILILGIANFILIS